LIAHTGHKGMAVDFYMYTVVFAMHIIQLHT